MCYNAFALINVSALLGNPAPTQGLLFYYPAKCEAAITINGQSSNYTYELNVLVNDPEVSHMSVSLYD